MLIFVIKILLIAHGEPTPTVDSIKIFVRKIFVIGCLITKFIKNIVLRKFGAIRYYDAR